MKNYIANALTKFDAYTTAMNVTEKKYKLDIEEIYDNIKKNANNGKFHFEYYIKDDDKRHTLTNYFKNKGYTCANNYDTIKDSDGKIIFKKRYIDIWWSIE